MFVPLPTELAVSLATKRVARWFCVSLVPTAEDRSQNPFALTVWSPRLSCDCSAFALSRLSVIKRSRPQSSAVCLSPLSLSKLLLSLSSDDQSKCHERSASLGPFACKTELKTPSCSQPNHFSSPSTDRHSPYLVLP